MRRSTFQYIVRGWSAGCVGGNSPRHSEGRQAGRDRLDLVWPNTNRYEPHQSTLSFVMGPGVCRSRISVSRVRVDGLSGRPRRPVARKGAGSICRDVRRMIRGERFHKAAGLDHGERQAIAFSSRSPLIAESAGRQRSLRAGMAQLRYSHTQVRSGTMSLTRFLTPGPRLCGARTGSPDQYDTEVRSFRFLGTEAITEAVTCLFHANASAGVSKRTEERQQISLFHRFERQESRAGRLRFRAMPADRFERRCGAAVVKERTSET